VDISLQRIKTHHSRVAFQRVERAEHVLDGGAAPAVLLEGKKPGVKSIEMVARIVEIIAESSL